MTDNEAARPIEKIAVLGGGSAGFLAAFALKKQLPEVPLVVVRSTAMGVIGVGEGTIWSVVNFLHRFLELDPARFHRECKPGIKLGIHYLWGPRPFFNYTFAPQLTAPLKGTEHARGYFCQDSFDYADLASVLMTHDKVCLKKPNGEPYLPASYAYHLENERFVRYLEAMAVELGIETVDDVVASVEQDDSGITALKLESGASLAADFFVDCSGFRAELIGKALGEPFVEFSDVLPCDTAIFGGWERTPDDVYHPYTTAETMDAGWSWRIEHDHVVNRGYVYCSSFIGDDEADAEFRRKNPHVKATRSVKFQPGVRRNVWVKNVLALGNAAGFVEPLEATAIGMI
ncbi:MAG: tryptophan 7-halogenase, partial [Pseudomonadota bacterium]